MAPKLIREQVTGRFYIVLQDGSSIPTQFDCTHQIEALLQPAQQVAQEMQKELDVAKEIGNDFLQLSIPKATLRCWISLLTGEGKTDGK